MPIRHETGVTREGLRARPETLFVYADNVARRGLGKYSREMRGEPNAVGIPTKRLPATHKAAFFDDGDDSLADFRAASEADFDRLAQHLRAGGAVVLPVAALGENDLKARAPRIWAELQGRLSALGRIGPG
ncbi:hypothetical protein OPKNFCMD_3667 [Methylobacterium crusticola]|uniref:DUF7831 domain-containing protein n=1 Tax=Methylobacterium crusticola TaxID=1697972 RepID=A0ABQ4QZS0_9HYPH|nr:hypothetical protein [Methylobacterium crusticola]GJD50918.1 hypothetical protein OPKNFCMD_3667 [Methylobacterium crusticola]